METPSPNPSEIQMPCRHLRCKEMYHDSPEDDPYASGVFWCGHTLEPCGPDGEPCGKKECCAARTCFIQ